MRTVTHWKCPGAGVSCRTAWVCRIALFALVSLAMPRAILAQPLINGRGILNAASFLPAGLPAGSIARGSLFSIFGSRLGPGTSPALTFPLQTTLGGVSIQVVQGATTAAAVPVYVSATQINAIMPSNAPLGAVSVYVTVGNLKSPPAPARVAADSFGIFTLTSSGAGPGVMQNFVDATTTPVNLPSVAAKPGQTIILYGTGLGAGLNADNVAPQAGNLPTRTEVFVGGQAAATQYSGRSPCCAGLDQIVFTVPANAPPGCWVPVQIRTSGATVSNTVTMAVSTDGSPCADSANALSAPFLSGRKVGLVALLRSDITEDVGLPAPAGRVTTDAGMMTFQQESTSPFPPFNPFFSLPPAGTCTTYTSAGDLFDGSPIPGGSDVGSFQAQVTVSSPLTWSNRDQTTIITRSQGFTVNWSGEPADQSVIVFGGGVDVPTNSSALFTCIALPGSSSLTVPSQVLGNIAPTRTNLLQSKGVVYVGALPVANPVSFSANGLDVGAILPGGFIGKTVIFQ